MGNQIMVYSYNEILISNKKERYWDIDERCQAQWLHIVLFHSNDMFQKKKKIQRNKVRLRAGYGKER